MRPNKEGFCKRVLYFLRGEKEEAEVEKLYSYSVPFLQRAKNRKSFAGFIVLLDINKKGEVEILIAMEDPEKKKGGKSFKEDPKFKFPGGSIEVDQISYRDFLIATRDKVQSEVKGIDFNYIGKEPFMYVEQGGGHVAIFYLAKLRSGSPRPASSLKRAHFTPEKQVRVLMKNKGFLFKHERVIHSLLNALERIREEKSIEEYILPLSKTYKEVIR